MKIKLNILIIFFIFNSCNAQSVKNEYKAIDLSLSQPKFSEILNNNSNIYWLGEQHGTKENYNIAFKMLSHISKTQGLDYLIIENSFLTEILLNEYLKKGDITILNKSIRNYKNIFYSNKELRNYLIQVKELYDKLPNNKKFQFVSIDIEQTYFSSQKYIDDYLLKTQKMKTFIVNHDFQNLKNDKERKLYYNELLNYVNKERINNDTIKYMVSNMIKLFETYENGERWDIVRDSLMYENFKKRNKEFNFKNKTSFAFFGTDHCYKTKNKKGVNWIAALIKNNHKDIKQNSTVILYKKCSFMRNKTMFPKLIRFLFKKIDTNFISHNFQNEPFKKLNGKKHLAKNRISNLTMWKIKNLNLKWNLITDKRKEKKNTEYIDNVILIVNSNHCEPYYGKE